MGTLQPCPPPLLPLLWCGQTKRLERRLVVPGVPALQVGQEPAPLRDLELVAARRVLVLRVRRDVRREGLELDGQPRDLDARAAAVGVVLAERRGAGPRPRLRRVGRRRGCRLCVGRRLDRCRDGGVRRCFL